MSLFWAVNDSGGLKSHTRGGKRRHIVHRCEHEEGRVQAVCRDTLRFEPILPIDMKVDECGHCVQKVTRVLERGTKKR